MVRGNEAEIINYRGTFLRGKILVHRGDFKTIEIVNEEEILLPGKHNVENCLAAITAIVDMVEPATIKKVLKILVALSIDLN